MGFRSRIVSILNMQGHKNISLGSRVVINYKTRLSAVPLTGMAECNLILNDGCVLGYFNHIYATHEIILGKNVLTADKVYITDNLHGYEDVNTPVVKQPVKQIGKVHIGDGAWLGENVCVMGANVGKGSVIGANSVVTKNIPDYCVAVGVPAKVIKKYNFATSAWERVN